METKAARDLVIAAVSEMTLDLDLGAVDRHFAPGFIQHSPTCPPGREGLKALMEHAKSLGVRYRWHRAVAEGELVVLQARATGLAELPLLIFDLYRVQDGKITEHWESMQPEFVDGMLDGPTEVTDHDRTDGNRELVRHLIEKVLVGGDMASLGDYFDGDALVQHNATVADGVPALRAELAKLAHQGGPVEYVRLHRVMAEGNFVFTQSEGRIDGRPHAFYELFRVADGKIAEHWNVHQELPTPIPHDNGVF